jgi:DNA-binding winged helix-turn-helix (wHTH) protein
MGEDSCAVYTGLEMPDSNRTAQSTGSFSVGDWLVVPSLNRLSKGEETVQLELKLMEVLVLLVRRAGELVSKRDLIDAVWKVEVISDGTLTRAIALLRKALDDDARHPRFIETIPKRGYRFVAPVEFLDVTRSTDLRFKLETPDGEIPLTEGENLIGRDPEATVRIDIGGVSRRHARIVIEGADVTLEDLGSKNGTYLRESRVHKPTRLAHGDEIRIGHKVARFRFVVED